MRKQINDIRIRTRGERRNSSVVYKPTKDVSFKKLEKKLQPIIEELGFKEEESVSLKRRNFLKIAVASGGVLLAGSFLDKINKFKNISLMDQSASALGPMIVPSIPQAVQEQGLDKDFENFFNNFRLVKNKKEFILYNKDGESIITIDRDV